MFNQKMKSIARRMKRNVLSREECLQLKIAQSLGLDKESSDEGKGTPGKTQAALRGNTSAREDPPG